MAEVINAACDSKVYDVVLTSYNFQCNKEVKQAIARAKGEGLGTVAMKVFAGGFLDKEKTKPINQVAAMKHVLNDENISTAIMSFHSFDQLNEMLPLMENYQMSEEEINQLEIQKTTTGLFCKGCGKCRLQCPNKLPISDLMRAYMYTYGYGQPSRGKEIVLKHNIFENSCSSCQTCSVECSMGFQVDQRINDIARLRNIPEEFLA